jgi:hypothetical protein
VFVELWDVGGSAAHQSARSIFYHSFHGVWKKDRMTDKQANCLDRLTARQAERKTDCVQIDMYRHTVNVWTVDVENYYTINRLIYTKSLTSTFNKLI